MSNKLSVKQETAHAAADCPASPSVTLPLLLVNGPLLVANGYWRNSVPSIFPLLHDRRDTLKKPQYDGNTKSPGHFSFIRADGPVVLVC